MLQLDIFEDRAQTTSLTHLMLGEILEAGPRKLKDALNDLNRLLKQASESDSLFGASTKEDILKDVLEQNGYNIDKLRKAYEQRRQATRQATEGAVDGGHPGREDTAGRANGADTGTKDQAPEAPSNPSSVEEAEGEVIPDLPKGENPVPYAAVPQPPKTQSPNPPKTSDPALTPSTPAEKEAVNTALSTLDTEIREQEERVRSAKAALEKATAKESGNRDLFGEDDAVTPQNSLFTNSEMGFDNSDQGIVNRTQKQRSDLAKEQQALDDLKSDATRNSRIRAAIANVRNQTRIDFQKATSPSTNEVPRAEASPQPSPSPRRSPVSVALRSALERILNRKGLLGDWEEGQKILDRDKERKAKLMGSTTRNRQKEIGEVYNNAELTGNQRKVVDAFSGKDNDTNISVEDKKGKKRNVIFRQGNEKKAGVRHSIFKHFNTKKNGYDANEVALIPDVVAKGERNQDEGIKVSYKYTKGEITYTVTTEVKGKNELFTNFYTNRKPIVAEQGTYNTDERHVQPQQLDSPAKLQKVPQPDKESTEKIFSAAKKKFGTTSDIREAGYVLPDGTMLDFSGRHEMMPGSDSSHLNGRRAIDHRAIWQIEFGYDAEGNEVDTGVKTSMPDFIERGAIRIDANAGTINLSTKPTEAQRKVLQRLIQRNGGDVSVDYGNGWDSNHYSEYEGAKANRVTADIDRYFDEGIKTDGNLKYYRTSSGEVYGFAYNGKIYIDPRIAGADTPIHEYTHLWADAMKLANPKTWQRIVGIMEKQTKLWNDIAKQYPELEDKDTLAAEVLAHYSGSKGAERLQKLIDETDTADASLYAQTVAAVHRMQKVLDTFWRAVAEKIGFRFSNAQTVADTILKDLLDENHTLASPATVRRDSVAPEMQEVQKRDTFYSNAQRVLEGPFKGVTWTASWKVKNGLKLEPKEKAALKAAGIPYENYQKETQPSKKPTTLSRLAPIEPSKPSTTPSEYSEYSKKSPSKNSHKATVAKAMGKIFGLDIDIIDNDANLTGDQARAKGWYDTGTGKITVVLPKNNGIADTVRTILHESVAHHGLRKLFGDNLDTFLQAIYDNAPQEIRDTIRQHYLETTQTPEAPTSRNNDITTSRLPGTPTSRHHKIPPPLAVISSPPPRNTWLPSQRTWLRPPSFGTLPATISTTCSERRASTSARASPTATSDTSFGALQRTSSTRKTLIKSTTQT